MKSPSFTARDAMTATSGLPLDHSLIERFLASLNLTPISKADYRKRLRRFFAWLDVRGVKRPGHGDMLAWREELMSGGRKPATAACYLNVACQFFQWAQKEGLYGNISEGIDIPRVERRFKDDTLTQEQVQRMLDSIDRGDVTGLRDYALLSLIVSCGLGYAEVSNARIGDIETAEGGACLKVGGEWVKIPGPVMAALQEYWEARGDTGPDAGDVCEDGNGYVFHVRGDDARLSAQSLKVSAMRLALQSGERLEDVQKFARHKHIRTTFLYERPALEGAYPA